jgi:PAS domain S-box-containing protein
MPIAKKLFAIEGGKPPRLEEAQTPSFVSKYEAVFDQASDAILTILPDGSIDAANQAIEEMSGFLKSELIGSSISLLSPAPGRARTSESLPKRSRPLSLDLIKVPGTYEDVVILRKDGYVRFVDLSVRLVSSGPAQPGVEAPAGSGDLILALFRDVTEKKNMERELITKHAELRNAYFELEKKNAELQAMQETLVQSGKLAALGELAAGIAHELNQPLQGIRGYAQELQYLANPTPEVTISLREIISNVDKMAAIIDHLRTFTRKSIEKHEWTDIHVAIEEALKMLSRQFAARGISVERHFAQDLPKIYANPLQLEQIFINLATNARDAIEAKGTGRGQISITTVATADFVEIRFRDDGVGMTKQTKAKAFNPFFTTKEVGKGMGLGLSLSYGILSKLNGSIVVESELGKGATFIVRIPKDFRELA